MGMGALSGSMSHGGIAPAGYGSPMSGGESGNQGMRLWTVSFSSFNRGFAQCMFLNTQHPLLTHIDTNSVFCYFTSPAKPGNKKLKTTEKKKTYIVIMKRNIFFLMQVCA